MGDIVSIVFNAPVFISEEKLEGEQNDAERKKVEKSPEKTNFEPPTPEERELFSDYLHCYFDACARELGNRDFDEYRAINADENIFECDLPVWHEEPYLDLQEIKALPQTK